MKKTKSKVKPIKQIGAQGDVLFRRVAAVPKGYERQPAAKQVVVAHSETGHHHAIDGMGLVHYAGPSDPLVCYLQLETVQHADVVHYRPWDTHATMRLLGGPGSIWEVRRQREHTPSGWVMVRD